MKDTHPFDRPAEDGYLEVLWFGELATLENCDRVNDAQASIKLSARDIVVHALSGGETFAQREKTKL